VTRKWTRELRFVEGKLKEPLRVKQPQIVFVNSMSDVCHPRVRPEWVDSMVEVMSAADWHFYMILTKRPNLIEKKFYGMTDDNPIRALAVAIT
jgi:protein gp37